jgi:mono/diheme cytochrome c family protein
MKFLHLLAIGLAAGVMVAACENGSSSQLANDGSRLGAGERDDSTDDDDDDSATTGGTTTPTNPNAKPDPVDPDTPVGATPNSPEGKQFYVKSVHPGLAAKCGACHGATGPGPNWLTTADADRSYAQLFQQNYVVQQSRIVLKGAHGGSTANVMTAAEIGTYNSWVAMELKGGGAQATPNVLAKLGGCFDRALFDKMQMQNWATTQRTGNNNTNQVTPWNENADNCTGCDNAPCRTCHSADAATNFVNAVGSPLLPVDYTFTETKKTAPAYISKFFGVGPDGKPVASNGIDKKSLATMKDKAYTHPMYKFNANQMAAINAFVDDAINKYNSTNGACGTP